jgi:hypothetical protein
VRIDTIFMITLTTYREAQFKGINAAEAGIQQAVDADWSVSEVREVRPHRFVVLFRQDQDCPDGVASAARPELPPFDAQPEGGHLRLVDSLANRVRAFVHAEAHRGGTGAMSGGAS